MRPGRTDRGDIFLLMLSSGPDARVLERVSAEYKRLGGRLGIAAGAARELLRREPLPTLRCRLDGNGVIGGGWVIVGRSRSYGGPYHATPGADPFAGPLEAVIQRSVGRRSALGFVVAMLFGFHVRRNDVLRSATQDVQLESVNGEVPYQIDGDPAGNLPVRIGIDGRELLLRVPSGRTRS
jgi:diacylglycerol kinase family enzyme